MTESFVPGGLRIGSVSYLNAKPLIHGIDPRRVRLDVPSLLADEFFAGKLDAALLPVFELLRNGGGPAVDDVAIACRGEVYSVIVASRGEFAECGEVFLDPSSRSSVALLRVLVAEFYPHLSVHEGMPGEDSARLIIGNPAIEFRRNAGGAWRFEDLGLLWKRHTGLPFVFAVWALSRELGTLGEVADYLRARKAAGLVAREEIAAGEADAAFALSYLTDDIVYDLGDAEKEALKVFTSLSAKHGLIASEAAIDWV